MGPQLNVSSDRLGERGIEPGLLGYEWLIHYTKAGPFDLNTGTLQNGTCVCYIHNEEYISLFEA